jgi:hypothetical protein
MELLALGDRDPLVLESRRVLAESPPRVTGGTEDELALLFREVGAAADGDRGDEERRACGARP